MSLVRHLPGISIVWLVIFSAQCSDSLADTISLPQSDGQTLVIDSPAGRVITLAPNLAEMMFHAGAGSRLVATVEYSNFPDEAAALPRIGDAFRFDLEQILELRPDLVIAWSSGNPAAALARLEALGLKVWRVELRQPSDIALFLRNVSVATGLENAGHTAAQAVETRLQSIRNRYEGKPPVRYFYQVSKQPLFTLNGSHIVSQGLALCGGENVFSNERVLAPQVSRESVLLADPVVFFAPKLTEDDDLLSHWLAWPRLNAVQNQALYYLSADKISQATPRMLDSLEFACNLLDQNRK